MKQIEPLELYDANFRATSHDGTIGITTYLNDRDSRSYHIGVAQARALRDWLTRALDAERPIEDGKVLPKITDEMFAEYWDTGLVKFGKDQRYEWTQRAVDFACLISASEGP